MTGRMRHAGKRDASRGDRRRSHFVEKHGDDAAGTPTPQTVLETSPGFHHDKIDMDTINLSKTFMVENYLLSNHTGITFRW